jgi:hypothetical protein
VLRNAAKSAAKPEDWQHFLEMATTWDMLARQRATDKLANIAKLPELMTAKRTGPPSSAPGGLFVADKILTIVVLWVERRAVPDAAFGERHAVPDAASHERYAAPDAASDEQRAAQRAVFHPVSYRTVLGRLVLERLVLERLAVPQHLTSSARWSARQSPRRRVREG